MDALSVDMVETEFDIRACSSHILSLSPMDLDVAVCTEVIEHQMYPLSLLTGINRHLKTGGRLYLTTNSVSFIGDILKLCAGRHWEALERSHVLTDSAWRPHVRLYTLAEVKTLLQMAGFRCDEGFYFDAGNVYRGLKGASISAVRHIAGMAPWLKSHIFIAATKMGAPSQETRNIVENAFREYGLFNPMCRIGEANPVV